MNRFKDRVLRAAKLDASVYEEVETDKGAMGQAMGVVILLGIAAGSSPASPGSSEHFSGSGRVCNRSGHSAIDPTLAILDSGKAKRRIGLVPSLSHQNKSLPATDVDRFEAKH